MSHKPKDGGFGLCIYCGRGVHLVKTDWLVPLGSIPNDTRSAGFYRHNPTPRLRVIDDRERTHCSACGKPGAWYEFKPGDGRCKECAP